MTIEDDQDPAARLVFEVDLDAPPEKVWRALTIKAFRDRWLPCQDLADAEPVSQIPGEEVRYRMRDDAVDDRESLVTFRLRINAVGGTRLRVVHCLSGHPSMAANAANANAPVMMMRAA